MSEENRAESSSASNPDLPLPEQESAPAASSYVPTDAESAERLRERSRVEELPARGYDDEEERGEVY
jgi:hypothetical protein